jgi:hypothetical protein
MEEMTESVPGTHYFDILVKWLGLNHPQKNRAAVTWLCRLDKPAVPLLVQEAIKPGKRSQHRVAILDVIERIGGPLGPDEMFGLQSLLRHSDPRVREKAEQVIMAASTPGLPDSPEGIALMRAFNPFLATPPRLPPRRTRLSDFAAALRGDQAAIRRRARSSAAWQRREERERGRDS